MNVFKKEIMNVIFLININTKQGVYKNIFKSRLFIKDIINSSFYNLKEKY